MQDVFFRSYGPIVDARQTANRHLIAYGLDRITIPVDGNKKEKKRFTREEVRQLLKDDKQKELLLIDVYGYDKKQGTIEELNHPAIAKAFDAFGKSLGYNRVIIFGPHAGTCTVLSDTLMPTEKIPPWGNTEEGYQEYVWKKRAHGPLSEMGNISLEARFTNRRRVLEVALDHAWLKDGCYATPGEDGASPSGFVGAGHIKNGETRTFEVATGPHEITVGDDFFASEALKIEVLPGQTVKLICSENFHGLNRSWHGLYYLFHAETPGKFYYFVKKSGAANVGAN